MIHGKKKMKGGLFFARGAAAVLASALILAGCSAKQKWSETETADGYMLVTNEGGATLGYSPGSGVTLLTVKGYAFKDLNRNGKLDPYEDWRLDANVRAADLASRLSVDDIAGLMLYSAHVFAVTPQITADQKAFLDMGVRAALSAASASPTADQVRWANSMQAYAEGIGLGIPVNISTDPRDTGVSKWPGNLALAATFDPSIALEAGRQLSIEYRALGIGTLLGPQIDLATEPRWPRILDTFGEDPALSRDMANASVSGYQSTYDASGNDLGWGTGSVNAMIKHWPGDGPAEGGRESHDSFGAYTVYPGGQFDTALIPFVDGGLRLDSATRSATAVMSSYSIAFSRDGSLGELVGSAFSEYKLKLLRSYGFDGVICTDWAVLGMESMGIVMDKGWGVEDLSQGDRAYLALKAGIDQFGGLNDPTPVLAAYQRMVNENGESAALARFQESGRRLTKNYFYAGLFDNPYMEVSTATSIVGAADAVAAGYNAELKSVVMLKNSGAIAAATGNKPTVYIPLVYTPGSTSFFDTIVMGNAPSATATLPVDRRTIEEYFNVVTDTVAATLTGPAGADGKATLAYRDIIRASSAQLASCDAALIIVDGPANQTGGWLGGGYVEATDTYIPVSLQYGPYTANGSTVRTESIAGPMVDVSISSPYGVQIVKQPRNVSYYGQSAIVTNGHIPALISRTRANMPAGGKVIVAVNTGNPLVVSEFEAQADAILLGFGVNNKVFLDIASGRVEPSGLLPFQMPAGMDTVEAQFEDVPRDMTPYTDSAGNKYDFAFGLSWSGVIQDERTAKYGVPALVKPVAVKK